MYGCINWHLYFKIWDSHGQTTFFLFIFECIRRKNSDWPHKTNQGMPGMWCMVEVYTEAASIDIWYIVIFCYYIVLSLWHKCKIVITNQLLMVLSSDSAEKDYCCLKDEVVSSLSGKAQKFCNEITENMDVIYNW